MRVGARFAIASAIALWSANAWAVPSDADNPGSERPIGTPTPTPAPMVSGTAGGAVPTTESGATPECVQCEIDALKKTVGDLRAVIDAGAREPFGKVANAIAKRMDVAHDLKIKERGCGTLIGTKAYRGADTPRDVYATDCTTYVVDVLAETYEKQGRSAEFARVMRRAQANSPNGLKGTELIKALQAESGWTALFWAPDTSTSDSNGEHRYAAHVAKTQGTYYKIPVDKTKAVINYRPQDSTRTPDTKNLERLKRLPFGVLAAKGGMHMSLVLDGKVYEVHWSDGCESMRLIEDTELEKWGWNSGVIAAPKAEMDKAWRDP